MPKVAVTVEHTLGQPEARRRIGKLLPIVRELGEWTEQWTGDHHLTLQGRVRGQSVTGDIFVGERSVNAVIVLPWMLGLFSGRIKAVLEQSARQALANS